MLTYLKIVNTPETYFTKVVQNTEEEWNANLNTTLGTGMCNSRLTYLSVAMATCHLSIMTIRLSVRTCDAISRGPLCLWTHLPHADVLGWVLLKNVATELDIHTFHWPLSFCPEDCRVLVTLYCPRATCLRGLGHNRTWSNLYSRACYRPCFTAMWRFCLLHCGCVRGERIHFALKSKKGLSFIFEFPWQSLYCPPKQSGLQFCGLLRGYTWHFAGKMTTAMTA